MAAILITVSTSLIAFYAVQAAFALSPILGVFALIAIFRMF